METSEPPRYVAFGSGRLIAEGTAQEVLPVLKRRHEKDPSSPALVFDAATGQQLDFNLARPLETLLDRALGETRKGPGRPKLGVVSREVTLLPRHWGWLERQPSGSSAALRRLVDRAMKQSPGRERARCIRAALNAVLTAVAGDRAHYEEATRALFAGDVGRLAELVERWPRDLRDYAVRQAQAAAEAESADGRERSTKETRP